MPSIGPLELLILLIIILPIALGIAGAIWFGMYLGRRQCPACGKRVKNGITACPGCGQSLAPPVAQ